MSLSRRHLVLAVACVVMLSACAPANERPLRGAVPGTVPPTPPGVPPTLQPSDALRMRALQTPAVVTPQPSPGAAASPLPSPSAQVAPIVRTIAPASNAHVPATQPVAFSAVLVGRTADLASASLSVNGADAGAQIDKRSPRDWTIHVSQKLGNGTYTVRVLVHDASGAAGGFTWQVVVGEPEPPSTPNP